MTFSVIKEILLAILLGISQGFSEFLPISSTAHLRILSAILLNQKDIGLQSNNIIQLGTLFAVIQYFWKDLKSYFLRIKEILLKPTLLKDFLEHLNIWWNYPKAEELKYNLSLRNEYKKLENDESFRVDTTMIQIAIGTIPILILGTIFYSLGESLRDLKVIAIFLVIGSIIMFIAEKLRRGNIQKNIQASFILTKTEVLIIGLFQALSIFPGISRSGATISGALLLGRERKDSVKFSFLLSIPAIFIAGLKSIFNIIKELLGKNNTFHLFPESKFWITQEINLSFLALILGVFIAYLSGLFFLKWLLDYLSKKTFLPFIIYRLSLALVIFGLYFFKYLN
jgi:undecaprenyl-diphosphatase